MRTRMKRRQSLRRLEIIAVVAVVAVAIVVGFYLAMNTQSANDAYIGKPVSQKVYSLLFQASEKSLRRCKASSYALRAARLFPCCW